jgi:hypothetical protein
MPAYIDHHTSNGPTEAINGGLEALRGKAFGIRNLTDYRIRSLLHCGILIQLIDALLKPEEPANHRIC